MTMIVDIPVQTLTPQKHFNRALRKIRATGIKTEMNYTTCCRSCANLGDEPYIASFGGQGRAYAWVEGIMYTRSQIAKMKYNTRSLKPTLAWMGKEGRVENVFLDFNDLSAAEIAADTFREEGFVVNWDGTDAKCVVVKMF